MCIVTYSVSSEMLHLVYARFNYFLGVICFQGSGGGVCFIYSLAGPFASKLVCLAFTLGMEQIESWSEGIIWRPTG